MSVPGWVHASRCARAPVWIAALASSWPARFAWERDGCPWGGCCNDVSRKVAHRALSSNVPMCHARPPITAAAKALCLCAARHDRTLCAPQSPVRNDHARDNPAISSRTRCMRAEAAWLTSHTCAGSKAAAYSGSGTDLCERAQNRRSTAVSATHVAARKRHSSDGETGIANQSLASPIACQGAWQRSLPAVRRRRTIPAHTPPSKQRCTPVSSTQPGFVSERAAQCGKQGAKTHHNAVTRESAAHKRPRWTCNDQ